MKGNKYYIIAGEPSGDLHGGNLIKSLKQRRPDLKVRCWGGERMLEAGGELAMHYKKTSFMGFLEVLKNLPTILNLFKYAKKDITDYNPDLVILIDYPGFNLRLAKWLYKQRIPVVYYISPQVWAWKKNRVFAIKKYVKEMIVILPFEKDFYEGYGVNVTYVGHPLLDEIKSPSEKPIKGSSQKSMAILPGSRKQEIAHMLPIMVKAASAFSVYKLKIAKVSHIDKSYYEKLISSIDLKSEIEIIDGQTYDLLRESEIAIVSSGTATLETALHNVPQVVCYKGSNISYQIAKYLVNIPYISLVNLILNEAAVIELVQDNFTADKLEQAIKKTENNKEIIFTNYARLKNILGGPGASDKAAAKILSSF